MAPVRAHRTIPGCPDAYKRCSARNNPRLVRAVPHRRTAACAQRPLRHTARRLDLRRDFDKPRPSASARHQPPITPLSRPTLLTGQGLAQAEKPKPACSLAPHSSRASTGEERRIDLHPVLLRAGVLPRPDKLRASRERPAKLHEAPSSRQLRHVEPAGLASSSCCGTRSESVAERVGEHASGGLLSACHVFTGGTSSLCAQGSLGILATLQHNDAQLWKLNSPPVVLHQVGSC